MTVTKLKERLLDLPLHHEKNLWWNCWHPLPKYLRRHRIELLAKLLSNEVQLSDSSIVFSFLWPNASMAVAVSAKRVKQANRQTKRAYMATTL
jgi:hypothetical protein